MITIQPKHTPVPWKTNGGKHIYRQDHHIAMMFADPTGWLYGRPVPAEEEACVNAAFIVRAVNAHEELVEAVRAAIRALEAADDFPVQNCSGHTSTMDCVADDLKQAIAKLEGK